MTPETYFARREHGNHRVLGTQKGFQVFWPSGSVTYPSARQTIIALVNGTPSPTPEARDPHLTFDRYFKRGRFSTSRSYLSVDALDMFRLVEEVPLSVDRPAPKAAAPPLSIAKLGIDLEARGHEVRKLFFAGFLRRVLRLGYEPEEMLQEIYKGILIRNNGKCPFDVSKSSFGHYVHMVAGCIISNYHRKQSRRNHYELFGVTGVNGELLDVSEADIAIATDQTDEYTAGKIARESILSAVSQRATQSGYDPDMTMQCAELAMQGFQKSEIAARIGEAPSTVGKTLRIVRKAAREWDANQEF